MDEKGWPKMSMVIFVGTMLNGTGWC